MYNSNIFAYSKIAFYSFIQIWFQVDVEVSFVSIYTIKKNTEAVVFASMEIGLEVNADRTQYMVMSRDQNAG